MKKYDLLIITNKGVKMAKPTYIEMDLVLNGWWVNSTHLENALEQPITYIKLMD